MNNQINPFELEENSIDFKAYFFKLISHWKLFLVVIILAFLVARYINKRKERIYSLSTTIAIQEEQNPLFSSNTNIMFSWGGTSDKLESIKSIIKSRTHNEKVVKKLNSYISYYKKGKYRMVDIYKSAPFSIKIDTTANHIINLPITLDFTIKNKVTVSFNSDAVKNFVEYNYTSNTPNLLEKEVAFSKEFALNKEIQTPYFKFSILKKNILENLSGIYFVRFSNFNKTVAAYQKLDIKSPMKGASILELVLKGPNKSKIAAYLNTSIAVLESDQKNIKIQYAVKTKAYIDGLFDNVSDSLKQIEKDLGSFKQNNKIYDLSTEGQSFFESVADLDKEKEKLKGRIQYYGNLRQYLNSNNSVDSNIPVPAIIEIEDQTISSSVKELIALYRAKESLEQTVTNDFPKLKDIIREIKSTRKILNENIHTLKNAININLTNVEHQIFRFKNKLSSLPKKEQGLIKYQRKYNLTESNYNYLLQKRYEAGTVIAANVSEIKILDKAKDVGQFPIYPKPLLNYLISLIIGLLIPLIFVILKDILNNKIHTVEELENKFKIPILGVIGKNNTADNLIVYKKPKATTSESFRAIRSNLQFLFKDNSTKNKTIVITSSVSGEGKTFVAINIATVFALSEKKTILLGFDLRKPKIFDDFDLPNNIGLTNYLIGNKELNEVLHKTKIENLDLILSGPVPPNPSELIISKKATELITHLKETYDYIIIDTPPIGLVADSLELFKYADASLYVVRQGKTMKNMPKMIDDKYKNGEVKNISFVLNDFSAKDTGYGYGYGYGYGDYNAGYHDNEDLDKKSIFKKIFNRKK
ncbi:MAG: polysaccharide biosynthesis tyrosine autokinase [Flavobacteriaceae bacterium]|nr:polysaccharide biosynthesis tyrosine autokinase [Flavobacteriaceae bacterium]